MTAERNISQPYATSPLFQFGPSMSLAMRYDLELFVTQNNNVIQVGPYASNIRPLFTEGGSAPSPFTNLSGVTFDTYGHMYLSDSAASTITMIPKEHAKPLQGLEGVSAIDIKKLTVLRGSRRPSDVKLSSDRDGLVYYNVTLTDREFSVSAALLVGENALSIALVLGTGGTATTVISILPATGNGDRIGSTPFADVRITQAGLTSATVVAPPPSTLADGARRPVTIAITDIRDALGNTAPDGTRIALTADAWYRRDDGGWNNGSVGGTFLDGVATPNDSRFRTYTVQKGRVDATYSAETIAPLSVTNPRSSVIAVLVASPLNNHRVQAVRSRRES